MVQHLVSQKGWDSAGEGIAVGRDGRGIDLRLDWSDVKRGSPDSQTLQSMMGAPLLTRRRCCATSR